MTPAERRAYHDKVLPVMGFLGSIAFAALVLVIEARNQFNVAVVFGPWSFPVPEYLDTLVLLLAITSFLMIIGSLSSARIAALEEEGTNKLARFSQICLELGLFCFVVILPLLVFPAIPPPQNQAVGFLLAAEGILLVVSSRLIPRQRRPESQNS